MCLLWLVYWPRYVIFRPRLAPHAFHFLLSLLFASSTYLILKWHKFHKTLPPRSSQHLLHFSFSLHIPTFLIFLFFLLCPTSLLLSREVLSSHRTLDNLLSFIHDILITNSVINTLPNQCFSSIMADQSGLMMHRKLLDRLLGVNNVSNERMGGSLL